MDTSVVKLEVLDDLRVDTVEDTKSIKPKNKKQEIFNKFRTPK
jgi:hypothetical protein